MPSDHMRVGVTHPAVRPIVDRVSAFLSAVCGWMGAGLVITATTAWLIARSLTRVSAIGVIAWPM